jgi:chloramphenicol 3-O phosphotransferase
MSWTSDSVRPPSQRFYCGSVTTQVIVLPASMQASGAGIEFAPDIRVIVGPEFRTLEAAWMEGVAATARAGARVIIDEVFLGGAMSQQRWQKTLGRLEVLWVAVGCDSAIAAARLAPGWSGASP